MHDDEDDRFAQFVREHSTSLFRTAYVLTGDYQRAEDLLQSSLVRVYERWPRVEAMDHPAAYARKVLVSQSVSWWRRRSSHEQTILLRDEAVGQDDLDSFDEHERVWAAVLALPPRQRAVMVLRYYENLSEADIAEILGMAPGTVKSHAHAATRRLSAMLAEPTARSDREATS